MPPELDIKSLIKRPVPNESMHLNLRLSGIDAQAYRILEEVAPKITHSLRVRDSVRIGAFLLARREAGDPIKVPYNGTEVDLLELLGSFQPQTPMDTRKRKPRAR